MSISFRQAISQVKTGLKENNADARIASNKAIYSRLITISSLVMQRESDALRLASIQDIYQTLKCVRIEEAPAVDSCCGIKTKKKVYRTIIEIPETYVDTSGAIIKSILSVDNTSEIQLVTPESVRRWVEDSNNKYDSTKYGFYKDKHIYLIDPIQRINIEGFFVHDISQESLCNCNGSKSCNPFLDTIWMIPKKVQSDIIDSVIDSFVNKSLAEKKPEDININKNPNT